MSLRLPACARTHASCSARELTKHADDADRMDLQNIDKFDNFLKNGRFDYIIATEPHSCGAFTTPTFPWPCPTGKGLTGYSGFANKLWPLIAKYTDGGKRLTYVIPAADAQRLSQHYYPKYHTAHGAPHGAEYPSSAAAQQLATNDTVRRWKSPLAKTEHWNLWAQGPASAELAGAPAAGAADNGIMATRENGLPFIPKGAAVVDAREAARRYSCASTDKSAFNEKSGACSECACGAGGGAKGHEAVCPWCHCADVAWDKGWHQCTMICDRHTGSCSEGSVIATAADIAKSVLVR